MTPRIAAVIFFALFLFAGLVGCGGGDEGRSGPESVRVMTYNVEDVRTDDLKRDDHPRLRVAAARVQHLRPAIFLFNEMTYDQPGSPGYKSGDPHGQNARRFVEGYLSRAQADTLDPIGYQTVMLPVNTGIHSGFDLNNDGRVVSDVPETPSTPPNGSVAPQTQAGRAYGGDAWGFGTFPGQYGMALFVRDDLEILRDSIRTFRLYEWSTLPDAAVPVDSTTGERWYSDAEWDAMRLSSKSHWDVPVRLPDGRVLHVLASHPTPPTFDGAADRNGRRNHDEIRFWRDYLDDAPHVKDDSSRTGGLPGDAPFVIVGDLNADPDDGDSFGTPLADLLDHPRVQRVTPKASAGRLAAFPNLDPDDTARWGLRADYVLPSSDLAVLDAGVWRPTNTSAKLAVSDHFPVWVDIAVE